MYQIDHTQSEINNFQALINEGLNRPLLASEFTRSAPWNITPDVGNGMNNSGCWLYATNPVTALDRTHVYWRRINIHENRPSAGNVVHVTNADTDETIEAKICERFRFVRSELVITRPGFLPAGGKTTSYVLRAKADSYLYTGSNLTIYAKNTDEAFGPFTSYQFFGLPNTMLAGAPMYSKGGLTLAQFGGHEKTCQQVFAEYLTSLLPNTDLGIFTADNVQGRYYSNYGGLTVHSSVTPVVGADVLANKFYVRHSPDMVFGGGGAHTLNGLPGEMMDLTVLEDFVLAFREHFKVPVDLMKAVSGTFDSTTTKTLRFSVVRVNTNPDAIGSSLINTYNSTNFVLTLNRA